MLAQARQKTEQRAGLEDAGTQRVGDQHAAAPRAVGQAGHAERRIAAQFERIAVVVVLAAQNRMHALEAADGLQPYAPAFAP